MKNKEILLNALHALQDLRPLLLEAAAHAFLAETAHVPDKECIYDWYSAGWPPYPEQEIHFCLRHPADDPRGKERWTLEVSLGKTRFQVALTEKEFLDLMGRMREIKAKGREEE